MFSILELFLVFYVFGFMGCVGAICAAIEMIPSLSESRYFGMKALIACLVWPFMLGVTLSVIMNSVEDLRNMISEKLDKGEESDV